MSRLLLHLGTPLCGALASLTLVLCSTVAPAIGRETLSPIEATRIGMVSEWQRQMTISGGLAGMVDARIFVDTTRPKTLLEISSDEGQVLLRIPADQVNQFGQPIGLEEAKRLASLEIYRLKRRGITATAAEIQIPEIRLYVLGRDGTVEARDAETGRVLWIERYGNPNLPCLPMAVNKDFVIFINGVELIVLDATTGKQVATRKFVAVPLQAPVIVGEYVVAVCTGSTLEGFPLNDFGADRFTARVAGLPMAAPVSSPGSPRMMWPTDAGFAYAFDGAGRAGLVFRFPADGLISSKMAAGPGERFFMATEKGQVYGLSAAGSGRLLWRQSLGDPVYDGPHLIGEHVFVKTVYGDLFCLDAANGQLVWPRPVSQIDAILGGTENQLLVRTHSARLEVIDTRSAAVLAEFLGSAPTAAVDNPFTDRIYLLSTGGSIQCLRPITSELPKILQQPVTPAPATTPESPEEAPPEEPPFEFGDPAEPAGDDDANPFGGDDANPFDTGDNDPFAGPDPFGS